MEINFKHLLRFNTEAICGLNIDYTFHMKSVWSLKFLLFILLTYYHLEKQTVLKLTVKKGFHKILSTKKNILEFRIVCAGGSLMAASRFQYLKECVQFILLAP